MPTSGPPLGNRLPKNKITKNDSAGNAGTSQAFSKNQPEALTMPSAVSAASSEVPPKKDRDSTTALPLHQVHLREIHAAAVAIDHQDDSQPHAHFGGGHSDHEQREHLA